MDVGQAQQTHLVQTTQEDLGQYRGVIAYPEASPDNVRTRIEQLRCLGVKQLVFTGRSSVNNTPVLGKGCVGIVIEAQLSDGRSVAVKIRRTDANRPDMSAEAGYQRIANTVGVGPILLAESADVLIMDIVKGQTIPEWVSHLPPSNHIPRILLSLLRQCHILDKTRLDHGELSHAHKNVLVTENDAFIIDYESASVARKPSNLTSIVQYLFLSGQVSPSIRQATGNRTCSNLRAVLKRYKRDLTSERFQEVVELLGLGENREQAAQANAFSVISCSE